LGDFWNFLVLFPELFWQHCLRNEILAQPWPGKHEEEVARCKKLKKMSHGQNAVGVCFEKQKKTQHVI
jgi:hypothetical protein